MAETAIIYALSDPRKPDVIRYIGKTQRPLKRRLHGHVSDGRSEYDTCARTAWTRKLLSEGLKPRIWPLEICPKAIWEEREKYWITFFRPLRLLLNSSDGGEPGPIGFHHSEETKLKWKEQRKGKKPHPNNIAVTIARNKRGLSAEIRAKISKTLTGRKGLPPSASSVAATIARNKLGLSDDTKAKISKSLTGRKGAGPSPANIAATIARNKRGLSPESIAKMAASLRGRRVPREQVDRMMQSEGYKNAHRKIQIANEAKSKKVLCLETGEIFQSINAAARAFKNKGTHLKTKIANGWKVRGLTLKILN